MRPSEEESQQIRRESRKLTKNAKKWKPRELRDTEARMSSSIKYLIMSLKNTEEDREVLLHKITPKMFPKSNKDTYSD